MRSRGALAFLPLASSLLLLAAPAAAAEPAPPDTTALPASPAPPPAVLGGLLSGTRLWGSAYYQAVAADGSGFERGRWSLPQEAGLSVNVRSVGGVELLGNFVFPLDQGQDGDARTVMQQLAVRVSPGDRLTLIAGKQRLNWGTAKVFSAIDTLEPRPNPLDVRPLPPGVAGLKAVLIPTELLSFSGVALPASRPRASAFALRADLVAEDAGLDLGVGVVRYAFLDRGAGPEPVAVARPALLTDGAWSHGDLVLYEEAQLRRGRQAGYRFPAMSGFEPLGGRDRWVFRGLVGATYQLDVGLTRPLVLLGEYLYNGDGLGASEARAFAGRLAAWQGAGFPPGAQIPDLFGGIGGLRRHYLSAGVQSLALDRYLLLSLNGILGLDGLFSRSAATLEWDPSQGTAVSVRYEYFDSFASPSRQPTELILIPSQHRITASFTASY